MQSDSKTDREKEASVCAASTAYSSHKILFGSKMYKPFREKVLRCFFEGSRSSALHHKTLFRGLDFLVSDICSYNAAFVTRTYVGGNEWEILHCINDKGLVDTVTKGSMLSGMCIYSQYAYHSLVQLLKNSFEINNQSDL